MEVRGYMDGGEAIFFGSGFRWDRTRMKDGDAHLETWMGLRWCLYGSGMQLLGPGCR